METSPAQSSFFLFQVALGDVPKCWIRSALLWNCLLCCGRTNHSVRYYFVIDCTLPTLPSVSLTLIPWGWVELLVRIFLTMPSVNLPLRWSCFKTIFTRIPGLIWLLCWLGCISDNRCFAAYSVFARPRGNPEPHNPSFFFALHPENANKPLPSSW